MTDEPTEVPPAAVAPTCYRHAGRETYIRCQRCERPICPDCMNQASVGFQCPDCVAEGAKSVRQARTAYGGVRVADATLTKAFIGLNVLVFVLITATGGGTSALLPRLALLPVGTFWLIDGQPTFVEGVYDGAYYQLITAAFTHVQLWHIGFNMLALWVLGPQLELMLGRWRFAALYLLSALSGSVFVYWLAGVHSLTVGASGAIFGLMAALVLVAYKVRGDVRSLITLVAINVAITVIGAGYISWQGHLGGFVGGLLVGAVLVFAPKQNRTTWQVAGVAVITVGLIVAVALRSITLV